MNKITHIISGLGMGGAERSLFNLLSKMKDQYEFSVISLGHDGVYGEKIRNLGIPVYFFDFKKNLTSCLKLVKLMNLVRDIKPDLIQGWMYHGNLASYLVQESLKYKPALAWNIRHSLYSLSFEKSVTRQIIRLNKLFSKKPNIIFYNSDLSKLQHEDFGFSNKNSVINYNGFDIDDFKPNIHLTQFYRDQLNIKTDAKVIGHIARFHPMKNHAGFIAAAIKILETHDDVIFILAGTDVTKDNYSITKLIPDNLICNFRFMGEQTDIKNIMYAMDLFCLSSAWGEGFPNVLGEAMSLGIPCITTDIAQCGDIVGSKGVVVPPNDTKALINELKKILELSKSDLKKLSNKSRERIVKNFSLEMTVLKYQEYYDKYL